MKTNTPTIQIIFSVIFSLLAFNALSETLVNFQDIKLEEASNQGKKILVSFSAEWCLPCNLMDESIFSDPEIATLVNDNFVSVKADIDSEIGNEWNDLYNANYLPTTLFASSIGQEFERLNGVPSREEFLSLLKKILSTEKVKEKVKPAIKPITKQVIENTVSPIVNNYLVQMGAFLTNDNAQNLVRQLEKKEHYNHSIIQESTPSGQVLYKVVLIGFKTEAEAIKKLMQVQRQGFDGFIKKL